MRAIIQRVMKASVTVGDEVVSSIGPGICVLIGISRDDNKKDIEYIVRKILNTRLFEDDSDKRWMKSVKHKQYEVLCVSQFTLYHILKGNKPDFHLAMGGEESKTFYEEFLGEMKKAYKPQMIKDGAFGAYMQVNIQNDGPVTITVESPKQEVKERKDPRQQKSQKCQPSNTKSGENKCSGVQEDSLVEKDCNSLEDNVDKLNQGNNELDDELKDIAESKLNLDST